MTPEQREGYERRPLRERPKYIPMKPEKIAKLSSEDRIRELLKNNKNTYTLRSTIFVKHFEEIRELSQVGVLITHNSTTQYLVKIHLSFQAKKNTTKTVC
jgi:hypothetical protein